LEKQGGTVYKRAIAGAANNTTGLDSLQSMFKVAPYNASLQIS